MRMCMSEFVADSSPCRRLCLSDLACRHPSARPSSSPHPTHADEMSQMQNSNSGSSSKRKTDASVAAAAAESSAQAVVTDNRAVRQRTDQRAGATQTDAPTAPTAPAAADASSSSSSSTPPAVSSFLRLAVVERQLVMQGLDLSSLARLASTCRQVRGEALDKESGKFIPSPCEGGPLEFECQLRVVHSAHDSPLFRKHAAMVLWCVRDHASNTESLIDKAAQFTRVVSFRADQSDWWTEERMLQLLTLPRMQHVTELNLSSEWSDRPLVQTALLGLPGLKSLEMTVRPDTWLLPNSYARTSELSTLMLNLEFDPTPGSLRALCLCPSLTRLCVDWRRSCEGWPLGMPPDLVFCLPPTLTHLQLGVLLDRDLPRPLVKALFSRTPLLVSLSLAYASIEATLCGLLDAGVAALPSLRDVWFISKEPDEFSVGMHPDPLLPIFRRFVHRFPHVSVRIEFRHHSWDDPELLRVQTRYLCWPSLTLWASVGSYRGPPSPHPPTMTAGATWTSGRIHSQVRRHKPARQRTTRRHTCRRVISRCILTRRRVPNTTGGEPPETKECGRIGEEAAAGMDDGWARCCGRYCSYRRIPPPSLWWMFFSSSPWLRCPPASSRATAHQCTSAHPVTKCTAHPATARHTWTTCITCTTRRAVERLIHFQRFTALVSSPSCVAGGSAATHPSEEPSTGVSQALLFPLLLLVC